MYTVFSVLNTGYYKFIITQMYNIVYYKFDLPQSKYNYKIYISGKIIMFCIIPYNTVVHVRIEARSSILFTLSFLRLQLRKACTIISTQTTHHFLACSISFCINKAKFDSIKEN